MYYPHCWITADLLILVDRLRYVLPSLLDHSRSTLGGPVEICTTLTVGSQQIYSSWWTGWDMYYPHCWITADLLLVDRLRYVLPSLLDHSRSTLGGPVEICTTLTVGSQQIYSWWTGWDMYYPHWWITADLLILVDRLRYVLPSLLDHIHCGGQQIYSMYYPHCWITDLLILVDRLRYVLPSLLDNSRSTLGGPVEICTTLTVGSQIYSSWWTGWNMYYPHCWITADLLILVDRLRYVLPSLLDHSRSTHLGGSVEICTTLTVGSQIYSSWWTGWDMYYPHCWITADLLILVDRLRYVLPSLLDHSRSTVVDRLRYVLPSLLDHSRSTHLGGPVEICTTLTVGSQIYSSWWTGWDMYYPHWWITADLLWWIGWDMYYPHCWITADLLWWTGWDMYYPHCWITADLLWWTGWDMYYPHCWITDLLIWVDRLRYVLPSLLDHSRSTHLGGPVEIFTTLTVGSLQIYSWWTGWDMYYPHCWITADLLWWTGWDMYYPHCWITDLLIWVDRLRYVLPSLLDHSRSTHLGGPVEICTTLTVGSQQIYSWWTGWDMYYPHCWITADLLILVDRLRYVLCSLLDHSRSTHLGGPVEICTILCWITADLLLVDRLRYVLSSLVDHRSTLGGLVEICTILTGGSHI